MAVYVNTNVSALHGQRSLNNIQSQLTTSYQRLASGMRINSAKDDAAGLQISSRLTTQVNGLNQGNRNSSDGIALLQTAEGALEESVAMLQKARTLAVQAANGTNTQEDIQAINKEMTALFTEINRIGKQTRYGGKTILDGSDGDSLYGPPKANQTGNDGQYYGQLDLQVGANKGDTITVRVTNGTFKALAWNTGLGDAETNTFLKYDNQGNVIAELHTGPDAAQSAIEHLTTMINGVEAERASMGALMNRLESSIRNQANVAANQADARSRIRDADFAEETANLSQQSIIQQAASSMLMQANTRPQLGLSLLG